MRNHAAEVEPVGLERRMDLLQLRLPDQALTRLGSPELSGWIGKPSYMTYFLAPVLLT